MRLGYGVPHVIYTGMGKRIDDLQYQKNVSSLELANICGCDRKTIYNLKYAGDGKIAVIARIAKFFGVSIDYLFYGGSND